MWCHVKNWKPCIFISTRAISIKLGTVLPLVETLPLTKSHVKSRDKKTHCTSTSTRAMGSKLEKWWLRLRGSHLLIRMSFQSFGCIVSLDKIKIIYLDFHKTHTHQTWHSADLRCGAPTYQVMCPLTMWLLDVTLQNKNLSVACTTYAMPCDVTWQIKYLISSLPLDL